jgi:hypothetical protein
MVLASVVVFWPNIFQSFETLLGKYSDQTKQLAPLASSLDTSQTTSDILANKEDVPPGVEPDVWANIVLELKLRPDGEQELHRLQKYYEFYDRWRKFELAVAENQMTLPNMGEAQWLQSAVNERLRNHEVTGGEAMQMQYSLLERLEPNVQERERKLKEWQGANLHSAEKDDVLTQSQRQYYSESLANAVAAIKATNPGISDKELEIRTRALRQATFSSR